MKPYYKDKNCIIYHGDSREIVRTLGYFDLILTDPPYGMNYQSRHRSVRHKKIQNDGELDVDFIKLLITRATKAAYFFCRWDNLYQMPKPKSVIAWVKDNWSMGDLKHEHGRQWEACCFYPSHDHKFTKRIPDVIQCKRTKNNLHPTEKPVDLLQKIISANECQTILDPYMGSGTTLRAAANLNKKCVGIEVEEKYCEIAVKRLSQLTLF